MSVLTDMTSRRDVGSSAVALSGSRSSTGCRSRRKRQHIDIPPEATKVGLLGEPQTLRTCGDRRGTARALQPITRRLKQRETGLAGPKTTQVFFHRRMVEALRIDGSFELQGAPDALLMTFSPGGDLMLGISVQAKELLCWRVSGLTYTLRPSSLEPPPAGHMCALRCPLGAAHPPCPANCTRPNKRPCHGHAASPPGPATVQILHPTPSIDAVEFPRFFAPCWTAALSEGTELLSPDLLRFSGCGHFCIVATSPVPAPGDSPASLPLTLHSVRLSDGTRVGSYHIPDAAAPLSPRSVQVCDSHAVVLTRGECDGMWVVRVCDDGSLEPRHHIGPECHPDDAVLLRGVADDEAAFQQRVHDALTASTRGAAEAAGTTQATGHEERQGSGVALPGEAGFSRGRVMEAVFEGGRGCLSGLAQKMMTWMTRWHWGQDGSQWLFRHFAALASFTISSARLLPPSHLLLLLHFPSLPLPPNLPRLLPPGELSEASQHAALLYNVALSRVEMVSFLPTPELLRMLVSHADIWGSNPGEDDPWAAAAQGMPAKPAYQPCCEASGARVSAHMRCSEAGGAGTAPGSDGGEGATCAICDALHPSRSVGEGHKTCQLPLTRGQLSGGALRRPASYPSGLASLGGSQRGASPFAVGATIQGADCDRDTSAAQRHPVCYARLVSDVQQLLHRAFSHRSAHPSPLLDPTLFRHTPPALSLRRPAVPTERGPIVFVSVRQQNAAVRAQEGGASRADGGRGGEAEDAGQGAGEEEMEARRRRARARVADMMRERDLGAYGRRRGVRVHMAVPARLDGGGGESGARIKHLVHPYLPLVVVSALQPGHAARAAVVTRSDCQGMLF